MVERRAYTLKDLQSGDPSAAREAYRDIVTDMQYSSRRVTPLQDVPDAVQEGFLRVLRRVKGGSPISSAEINGSYFSSAARTSALDMVTRGAAKHEVLPEAPVDRLMRNSSGAQNESPDQSLEETALFLRLFSVVGKDRGSVLLLSHYGYSDYEIASEIGVDLDTVRSRRNRARKILRERFREVFGEEYHGDIEGLIDSKNNKKAK